MHLIQLLLPLTDQKGQPFARQEYERVRRELTEKFGGVTAYTRSPARGLWKESESEVVQDEIVIYEVMVEQLDAAWWGRYREGLCRRFEQEDLVVRALGIQRL